MGCGTCMRVILFITNVIFALASLALIGVGVAALLAIQGTGPIIIIVVGAIACVVSFFGCCGAIMGNKCMLFTYSILLIVLMNLKTALATMIIVGQDSLKEATRELVNKQFDTDPQSISGIEKALECCGTVGASSYPFLKLPASCCKEDLCTMMNAFHGCHDAIAEFVEDFSIGIAACCFILGTFELIGVIFGLCLANNVSNKYRSRY